jgi:hypothetical protein
MMHPTGGEQHKEWHGVVPVRKAVWRYYARDDGIIWWWPVLPRPFDGAPVYVERER